MPKSNLTPKERLLALSRQDGDCLLWIGSGMGSNNYGQIKVKGKKTSTHRLSYQIHHGDIPAGMIVMHRCDNPRCINPDHLVLGTQADNMQDMQRKGRSNYVRQADNGRAKLTPEQVTTIRQRYQRYNHQHGSGQLARDYGVTTATILSIIYGDTWKT